MKQALTITLLAATLSASVQLAASDLSNTQSFLGQQTMKGIQSSSSSGTQDSAVAAAKRGDAKSPSFAKKKAQRSSRVTSSKKPLTAADQLRKDALKSESKKASGAEMKVDSPLLLNGKKRAQTPQVASKSHDFWIHDARAYLIEDLDNDGYYSEFQIEFDADTAYSWAEVYAVMYISRNGGDWYEYFETSVFEINGTDSTDDYRVTTRLNTDYPTDEYDILIDLYEYGYSGVVATYSSNDDIDLYALPLEDRANEYGYTSGFEIFDITTDLITDADGDGFYSEFGMSIDIDTDFSSAEVYVELYFYNEYGEWELEHTSDDFVVEGGSILDTLLLEFEWQSGYPTDEYDFKVIVRDSYSDERLIETFGQFGALNAVPLESVDRDDSYYGGNTGGSVGTGSSESYGSGGGALYIVLPLMLLGFLRSRKFKR